MDKKQKDIGFDFKARNSNYNNITARYLREERDDIQVFGRIPRNQKIDQQMVDWVREQQLNVQEHYREKRYNEAIKNGK